MKKIFISASLLLFVLGVKAQKFDKIVSKDYVNQLIKTLSADDMEGRRTFTPGIEKAATFIEKQFAEIGLKPLPTEKSYRQTLYKYLIKPQSASVKIDEQAIDEDNVMVFGNKAASLTFNQSTGEGWTKLDANKDFMSQFRALIRSNKQQLVLVDIKFVDAFRRIKGFVGKESVVDEKDLSAASNPALVFVLDKDTVANSYEVNIKNSIEKKALFNIVGMIPGKSKAQELVVFSGHYDHMGIVKPVNGDSIMNGADDDASGTTAMIALAKYYQKIKKNERTLIFAAFTAEEIGGFGAKYFSQQLNPDEVVAMFNIEMIGKESKFGKNTAFITGYEKSDFGKILQKNLSGTEFTFHPDPYPQQNLFYRSDNATLAALGVPAHTISTDQIDTDKHYHAVSDEYETLDVDNIYATIKAIAYSAISIVDGKDTPSRIPKLKSSN
jgi:hypothetical protein